MKIAIEAQRIFRSNKHGMDFVALEAIRRLQKIDHQNEYFILVSPGDDHCLSESENMHIIELKCPSYPLWEQFALPRAVKRLGVDLLHCTSNTAPLMGRTPLVVTLHDIIFLEKRGARNKSLYQNLGRLYRRWVVPRILPCCEKIITVSRFERDRIRTALKLPADRIVAIHNGFSPHFHPIADPSTVTRRYLEDPRYLFFLGNTDPKKNTPRTLKAYALYLERSSEALPLLIADLREEVIDALLRENDIRHIKSHLRFPGYIPNTDLPAIYSGASAFLYTSLRESFGIPLLEAMACGTPVISSTTSAIPEVAGRGALLVDPQDEGQIADALLRLEQEPDFRRQTIEYGLQRVKEFSWEETASQLLLLYKDVLSRHA